MICEECLSEVEQAFDVREKTRDVEQFYFDDKRNKSKNEAYDGFLNFGFRVCRMCLSPDTILKMQSLFRREQQKAEKFKFCFGIDVRFDQVFDFGYLNLSLDQRNIKMFCLIHCLPDF